MSGEYPKIQTLYLRDPETHHRTLLEGQWAHPAFGYLREAEWVWTEKVDGTNTRISVTADRIAQILLWLGGKTDRAQIQPKVQDWFNELDPNDFTHLAGLTLYGEAYGPSIQKGGKYRDDVDFCLFDVAVNDSGLWLERESVEEIGAELGMTVAPVVLRGTPEDAVHLVKDGLLPLSLVATKDCLMEGLVGFPAVPLLDRRGKRVVTKLKVKDFPVWLEDR